MKALIFCFSILLSIQSFGTLTKRSAFELLKKNGYRWRQTEMITKEAAGQRQQAEAAKRIHAEIASREYFARINTIQFGLPDPGPLDIVSLGETVLQGSWAIIDTVAISRLEAAQENEKMSAENQKQYQSDLTYYMLLSFINTQRLKRKTEIVDVSIKRDSEILNIAKARLNVGQGIKVDLLRAEGLLKKDELRKLDTQTAYKKSKQELAAIIGQEKLDEDIEPLDAKILKSIPDEVILLGKVSQRPDVKGAKQLVLMTEKLKDMADNESDAKVSFMGGVGVVGTFVFGGHNAAVTGTSGVQLTIPIFDGGYFDGKRQEASAKNMTAQMQAKQVELEAKGQVRAAEGQIEDAKSALEASRSYNELAEEELRLIKRKFMSGASSGLELSTAQANLSAAIEAEIDAMFAFEAAKVNLYKSTGSFDDYFKQEGGR